jgi:hypothetical protein
MDITRHKDGTPVTYRDDFGGQWQGVVVETVRHGGEVNVAALDRKSSFLVETGCTHVTRVRVTDPGTSLWGAGQEVDVATIYLRPAQ